jgi:hypothetical protein
MKNEHHTATPPAQARRSAADDAMLNAMIAQHQKAGPGRVASIGSLERPLTFIKA